MLNEGWMMNQIKWLAIAASIALLAGPAEAATIAGWDFSQFLGSGTLSIDGQNLTDTLDANYSSLDLTNNAGAESATFGRLYFNGQFGSSDVTPVGDGSEAFTPVGGSLVSNLNAPVAGLGDNPFDSLLILEDEGQPYQNLLSMAATQAVQVVFDATLGNAPLTASSWMVSFGARAAVQSPLLVEFSSNGVNYTSAGTVTLNDADTPFSLDLTGLTGNQAFVRLSFTPPAGAGAQFIDNVAIQASVAPEPATIALLLAGLAGAAVLRSRG
jgi:hypothetical protein